MFKTVSEVKNVELKIINYVLYGNCNKNNFIYI